MKKTAIGFLALLLVSALCAGCLMSCGKGEGEPLGEGVAKFTDVFRADPDLDIDNGYKTQKILSLPAEMSDTQEGGPFFAYLDVAAGNYCVYNVDLDKTVLTLPKADIANADDIVLYDEYISVVKTTAAGDESTSIYGEGGSLLATATGRETADTGKDGFLLAGMLYHVEDGVLKKTYNVPSLFTMSDVGAFTDDYLVYYTARGAAFYDQSFRVAALYEVPADVIYFDVSPLAGGKLFIRYEIPCDIASDDYDCFVDYGSEGQSKFDIYTGIFDPKTGETETLDLGNIAVSNLYNEYLSPYDTEFYDVFKEDVDNILAYYLIKDRRIDRTQVHCVLLDNDGNVGASLDQFVSGQRGLPSPMSESCYRVMTATGYTIVDTAGNVLTSAPSVRSLQETDYGFIRIENSSVYVYAKDLSRFLWRIRLLHARLQGYPVDYRLQ